MTSKQENLGALTFGLDIGIASVGWAVLGENRIIDLGVRCFDKAETAKEGESLNLARRSARLLRRRLRRRAWRLTKLARLLKREGLIADANLFKLKIEKNTSVPKSSWQLRVDALDRQLTAEEWARVIYHLCKHRGFYWISRAEEKAAEDDSKGESGKVKTSLAETNKLMAEKGYRTAAEMVMTEFFKQRTDEDGKPVLTKNTGEPILDGVARNKQGDYSKALSRILLGDELKSLFEHQRKLGNTFATEKLEAAILGNGDRKSGLFWAQNPALAGSDLLKMLGHCTFEKSEYRAPKASFIAERHVWLTRLNNLRIVVDGTTRPLNEAERRVALPLPYKQAGDLTYKQLGGALIKEGFLQKEGFKFAGLPYPTKQASEEKAKDPEQVREGFVDVDTGEIVNPAMFQQVQEHFPNPWPHFRDEVKLRLSIDDPALLRGEMEEFGTYTPEALAALHPLFVSRAPQRRNSGAAHKDTIYAQPERLVAQGGVTQKVALSSLTLKDLDKLIDPHRNERLYATIRARLEQHGGKGDKAFPASNPLRKPDSEGNPTGPIVRGVTMVIDKLSGIPIRGGIAKNDSMVRVDVFTKANKFHLVPVYVHHSVLGLPNQAIVGGKDESEWTLIDNTFDWHFSIYPNDLIRVTLKQESRFGYYAGCDRSTAAIHLWAHDRNQQIGKDGLIRSIGVKTALSIEKFNVDVLGNIYPAPPEKRCDLA